MKTEYLIEKLIDIVQILDRQSIRVTVTTPDGEQKARNIKKVAYVSETNSIMIWTD